jgi:pyrophosphate--fructose-6-phosphate 1-phosphotransferase
MGLVKDYLDIQKENGVYKIGIERPYFQKVLTAEKLDPDFFGPVLFEDYDTAEFLMLKRTIMSHKTLNQALVSAGALRADQDTPAAIKKIYAKTVPNFKKQVHFYGYDGRGNDPTRFDCNYTYNLGWTVFSLIANGATGQMAAIKNLEKDFDSWEPIGIPIAPLMHLEERKGKLALVLEKSIVDINSNAFQIVKAFREKWLAATPGSDCYRRPGPIRFTGKSEEDRPITLRLNAIDI